jgi:hypothetical protein
MMAAREAAWITPLLTDPYSDAALRSMCDQGVEKLAADPACDQLRFDCWNAHETEVVRAHMTSRHPNIPFFTTRIAH